MLYNLKFKILVLSGSIIPYTFFSNFRSRKNPILGIYFFMRTLNHLSDHDRGPEIFYDTYFHYTFGS